MRICVFGAGSLGSALGGLLSRKNDVTLIGRRAHVRAILRDGLRLTGDVRGIVQPHASETLEGVLPPELLIVSTKAYDTAEAIEVCKSWTKRETLVLTLQNGLGNLEQLRRWKGRRAFGGTTTLGATLVSPGCVRVSGLGSTIVGSDQDSRAAEDIARTFTESGIPATTCEDVGSEIWSKAVVSACINPTTAILRVPNGGLLRSTVILKFIDAVCSECVTIARSCDVRLDVRRVGPHVRAVARNTARNVSSMLQDIQNGRRTEISQINGAFCRQAERHGLPCPLNRALTALVECLESQSGWQKG